MSNIPSGVQKNKFLNRLCLTLKVNSNVILNDYSLLFPTLLGIFSLFGLSFLFLLAVLSRQQVHAAPAQTETPFKYLLLATEVVLPIQEDQFALSSEIHPAPTIYLAENVMPTPTFDKQNGKSNETLSLTQSKDTEINASDIPTPTFTNTPNPIFPESEPMTLGTYDASDSHIVRNGSWTSQENGIAYQETLLVSNTVGNYIAFSFIGQQLVLRYQSSTNAGDISINIDGSEVTITQLVGNAWFSQKLEDGIHVVIITHASGESINLDYVGIPN